MATALGVVKSFDTWAFQESYVERLMDNAAYTAAHPDDTLVMAGPARKAGLGKEGIQNLLAIGMLQAVSFSSTKPTQPMMAIGSGRSFYVSGKAQTQWQMGRLFVNGRNMLRVLYHNAIQGGIDPSKFDDVATESANAGIGAQKYFINLDSELFLVPMGLGAVFRDKTHGYCGGFYAELCMITSYAIAWNAGQNLILENVSGMSDRLVPWGSETGPGIRPHGGVLQTELDQVLGFIDGIPDSSYGVSNLDLLPDPTEYAG
jgi:hypothetical protein